MKTIKGKKSRSKNQVQEQEGEGAKLGEGLADMAKVMERSEGKKGKGAMSGLGGSLALPSVGEFVMAGRESIAVVSNVRKSFPQAELEELAASIRAVGILQPLVVRPRARYTLHEPDMLCNDWLVKDATGKAVANWPGHAENAARMEFNELNRHAYELVAGERRLRAAELAGLSEVPCMVRTMTDDEFEEVQRIENLKRKDITALEEAQGYRDWMTQKGLTADQVAERIQMSRSHVFARLKLLKLSGAVREAVLSGKIPQSIGELLAQVPGEKQQVAALKAISEGGEWDNGEKTCMSVRAAGYYIENRYRKSLKGAPFDSKADYAGIAGPCAECPKRSGNMKDEFPEIGSPDVCTDPSCFEKKRQARVMEELAKHEQDGAKALPLKQSQKLFRYGSLQSEKYVAAEGLFKEAKDGVKKLEKAGAAPQAVAAADEHGKVHLLYPRAELTAALLTVGVKGNEQDRKRTEDDGKEKEREGIRKLAVRNALAEVQLTVEGYSKPKELRRVLEWVLRQRSFYEVSKRRACSEPELLDLVKRGTDGQLWALLVEAEFPRVLDWDNKLSDDGQEALETFGIEFSEFEKEAKRQWVEENKLPKDGEKFEFTPAELERFNDSNIASMEDGKLPGAPFEWRQRWWVCQGSCVSGEAGVHYLDVMQVVKAEDYKGPPHKERARDKDDIPLEADTYMGMAVTWKSNAYVLTGPEVQFVPRKEAKPAKAKKGKGKK